MSTPSTQEGLDALLERVMAHVAEARFTGLLRVRTKEAEGELWFVAGLLDQARFGISKGDEALARMRRATEVTFEAELRLPGITGDFKKRLPLTGAFADMKPVALMRHCEAFALTCTLELRGKERLVRALYQTGELISVDSDEGGTDILATMLESAEGTYQFTLPAFELPTWAPRPALGSLSIRLSLAERVDRVLSHEGSERPPLDSAVPPPAVPLDTRISDAPRALQQAAEGRLRAEQEAAESRLRAERAAAEANHRAEEAEEARREAERAATEAKRRTEEADEAAAVAKQKRDADEARRKAEREAREAKRQAEQAEARRRAEEEATAKRKREAEDAQQKAQSEAAEAKREVEQAELAAEARRKAEEEAKRKLDAEEALQLADTEAALAKSQALEAERVARAEVTRKVEAGDRPAAGKRSSSQRPGKTKAATSEERRARKALRGATGTTAQGLTADTKRQASQRGSASVEPSRSSGSRWILLLLLLIAAVVAYLFWSGRLGRS